MNLWRRRILPVVIAVAALASALGGSQARAGNPTGYPFHITLYCGNQSYPVVLHPGDAIQLEGSPSNFRVAIWFYTDENGVVQYLVNSRSDPRQSLLTCRYTGPASGFQYTVIGFFTPVG